MTDVLSRMLNDPATRAALSGGGEDSLEGVIDQQESNQRSNDNSTASNADANREQQQIETETDNDVQVQENTSSLDQSENPNNDEIRNVVRNNSVPSNDAQVSCDLAIQSSSVSTNNFNTEEPINNDLDDVQVTESQTNLLESNNTSTNSAETRSSDGECDTEGESSNAETSCHTDMASKREENMMENLQDRLTTMRDGFLER